MVQKGLPFVQHSLLASRRVDVPTFRRCGCLDFHSLHRARVMQHAGIQWAGYRLLLSNEHVTWMFGTRPREPLKTSCTKSEWEVLFLHSAQAEAVFDVQSSLWQGSTAVPDHRSDSVLQSWRTGKRQYDYVLISRGLDGGCSEKDWLLSWLQSCVHIVSLNCLAIYFTYWYIYCTYMTTSWQHHL